MTATFTNDELEAAALLLVIDEAGAYRWSSTKTDEEVGRVLRGLSYEISLRAILDAAEPAEQLADWHRSATAGLEETLRGAITKFRSVSSYAGGISWQTIGTAFGITRQAAWERFRRFDELGKVDPIEEVVGRG